MHKLTWYRQQRVDGSTRTAVDVDDTTLFHLFEPGNGEPDPALLWYVDLRCQGARLPLTPPEVLRWLLEQAGAIRAGFTSVAEELRAGIDADVWPVRRKVRGLPDRVKAEVVCCAARRLEGLGLAKILADIAGHWEERVRALPAVAPSRAG